MTDKTLPELPEPDVRTDHHIDGCGDPAYTADQLRTYGEACARAAVESGVAVPREFLQNVREALQRHLDDHAPRQIPVHRADSDILLVQVDKLLAASPSPPVVDEKARAAFEAARNKVLAVTEMELSQVATGKTSPGYREARRAAETELWLLMREHAYEAAASPSPSPAGGVSEAIPKGSPLRQVLADIAAERRVQDGKWGGPEHDDGHDPWQWVQLIQDYAGWARVMAGMDRDKYRRRMVQIAALAVAAVESHDRLTAAIAREKDEP